MIHLTVECMWDQKFGKCKHCVKTNSERKNCECDENFIRTNKSRLDVELRKCDDVHVLCEIAIKSARSMAIAGMRFGISKVSHL